MAVQHVGLGKAVTGLCLGAALALAAALSPAPAAAQRTELRPLLDRLDRMERELNLLQRQVYRDRVAPAPAEGAPEAAAPGVAPNVAARMEVRINDLESELRKITGRVEEVSFALNQLDTRLEKLIGDVDVRLSALEQSMATSRLAAAPAGAAEGGPEEALAAEATAPAEAGPSAEPPPIGEYGVRPLVPPPEVATGAAATGAAATGPQAATAAQATAPVLPAGTAKEQYDHARSLLIQRDYEGAEKALTAFIAAHPDDELTENARYWLGETHYVRSDFTNAAVVFAEGFQKFPNGSKAPDSLLKLGLSLAKLGETEQACKVFGELAKKFPDAPLNVRVRANRETQNLGCK